jgi:hypothetical protein
MLNFRHGEKRREGAVVWKSVLFLWYIGMYTYLYIFNSVPFSFALSLSFFSLVFHGGRP